MNYQACFKIGSSAAKDEAKISIEKEGLNLSGTFIDFADIANMRPINHRVFLDMADGSVIEISMLGFSYDGFWDELMKSFGDRSQEALFIEEELVMACEGEYELPAVEGAAPERGRGLITLYPDAVCILPQTSHAVRVPLCYTEEIRIDGYMIRLLLHSGEVYTVGKMGYDTMPFAERCEKNRMSVIRQRGQRISGISLTDPFTHKGIFRTKMEDGYWLAAFGKGCCAVELFTDEKTATYLYRFADQKLFTLKLEEAMEAVGTHREIIFMSPELLAEKPLYRMSVHRSHAVRFLRDCSAGRIIHSASHAEKLAEFLEGNSQT